MGVIVAVAASIEVVVIKIDRVKAIPQIGIIKN